MEHLNQRNYKCEPCDKSFAYHSGLQYHLNSIHGKNMMPCPYCDKKFIKHLLQDHISAVHLKESKYKCEVCEKSFGSKVNRRRHVRLIHENADNVTPVTCTICEKTFRGKFYLKKHISLVHDNVRKEKMQHL